jgi:hypothetical protein
LNIYDLWDISLRTYDQRWQEAMSELNEQVHIEDHTLSADGVEANQAVSNDCIYIDDRREYQHLTSLFFTL